jgi:hypothetical protein
LAYQLPTVYPGFPSGQQSVIRLEDNATIPFDPGNIDYQAYLEWVSQGNVPLPASALLEPGQPNVQWAPTPEDEAAEDWTQATGSSYPAS